MLNLYFKNRLICKGNVCLLFFCYNLLIYKDIIEHF